MIHPNFIYELEWRTMILVIHSQIVVAPSPLLRALPHQITIPRSFEWMSILRSLIESGLFETIFFLFSAVGVLRHAWASFQWICSRVIYPASSHWILWRSWDWIVAVVSNLVYWHWWIYGSPCFFESCSVCQHFRVPSPTVVGAVCAAPVAPNITVK
jgi:hypothetical protein